MTTPTVMAPPPCPRTCLAASLAAFFSASACFFAFFSASRFSCFSVFSTAGAAAAPSAAAAGFGSVGASDMLLLMMRYDLVVRVCACVASRRRCVLGACESEKEKSACPDG